MLIPQSFFPKAIVLDLDGTLLRGDLSISVRSELVLQVAMSRGIEIVIATSHPPRFLSRHLPSFLSDLHWICYNGAAVYQQGVPLSTTPLSIELAGDLIRFLEEKNATISVEINDTLYVNREIDTPWEFTVTELTRCLSTPPIKILFDASGDIGLTELMGRFGEFCSLTINDNSSMGQVMARGVSKATAARQLLLSKGIEMAQVASFGDDMNDLELIVESGYGVVMGNANPRLKHYARYITDTNEQDGVAKVLEQLLSM